MFNYLKGDNVSSKFNSILGIILLSLVFPLVLFVSLILSDYSLKVFYLLLFVVAFLFILFVFLKPEHVAYISRNIVLFLVFVAFLHTFFRFTVFPIIYGFEYNHIMVTAMLFMLVIFTYLTTNNDISIKRKGKISLLTVLIISSLFISIVIINYKDIFLIDGISKLVILFSSLYFFGKIVPMKLSKSDKLMDLFIIILFLAGSLAALIGIITVIFPYLNPVNEIPGVSISFFTHPNANAFFYCYTIPCGLYIYFKHKNNLSINQKLILISAIALMFVNQILTFNRSGIIAVLLGISIYIFYYNKKLFAIIAVCLPFLVLYLYNVTTSEKGASTVVGRVGLLSTGIEMLANSRKGLLWGFGIESNFKVFEETKSILLFQEEHNYPHNSFLFLILEFGLIAFTFIISFLIKIVFPAFLGFIKKKLNNMELLSLSILISVIFQSIFEDFMLFPQYYLFHLFILFVGILVISGKNRAKLKQQQS